MTFSPLASRAVPHSGKYASRQGVGIQRMIVHHWAGTNGGDARLINPSQEVSTNYILYSDGSLVGQVPEEYRAWTSGSWNADAPSITVETQNTTNAPEWRVSDASIEMLAQLAADLCRRYGWGSVDRSRVRGHQEFAATACPGPYLYPRLDYIINRANEILNGTPTPQPTIPEEDEDMNTYFEASSNSSPVKAGDSGTSRIWAGDGRVIGGATYSGVWERSQDGSIRRLFKGEWEGIKAAYAAAGRKLPVAKVHGNVIEQIYLVTRTVPVR